VSSVREVLAATRLRGVERLDAQLLLAHVLGRNRTWLLTHDDSPLEPAAGAAFEALASRRVAGEPLAYLVGIREFHGLSLQVDARVLVPRPDTEVLVDWAIELLRGELAGIAAPEVVDLGTGSGAIALAVSRALPRCRMTATDASAAALAVARANAGRLGLSIETACGSWWSAVQGRRFSLAISNPPYIAAGDAHLRALRCEPLNALTPGTTGLEALLEIIAGAADQLLSEGWLLLEHGFDQAEAVRAALQAQGFKRIAMRPDLAGLPRCTGGQL